MSQSHLNKQTTVQTEAYSEGQLAERTERLRLRLSRKILYQKRLHKAANA